MVLKKTALLLLLILALLNVYAEDGEEEEDVKVPVKLNNRLKSPNKNFNPAFSRKLDPGRANTQSNQIGRAHV